MQTKYNRLTSWEREEISLGLAVGQSVGEIARELQRSKSSIAREINQNSVKTGYRPISAQRISQKASSSRSGGKRKLVIHRLLQQYVHEKLKQKWPPDEISVRIKVEYAQDMTMRISPEAIYQYLYVLPKSELKKTLLKSLRQERAYRRKQERNKKQENRGKISEMISIEERPVIGREI
jgi:IS30 family transposase